MGFDLASAKPVGSRPTFDLASAKPIAPAPEPESESAATSVIGGAVEPVLHLASGAVAAPIAGIAGAVAAPFVGGERASDIVQKVQGTLTYQPQTQGGKAVSEVVTAPFEWLAKAAKGAGGVAMDLTGNPELATGVETAVNFLPALVLKGAKGLGAGKQAATGPAAIEAAAIEATKRAGLSWERLPGRIRLQILNVARDSRNLEKLPPEALEREGRMASHPEPITPTRGQATRDPVQMGLEKDVSQTQTGKAVRQRMVEQNDALVKNVDLVGERTGARAPTREAAGEIIQGAARAILDERKAGVSKLYKKAENAGEMDQPVTAKPLHEFMDGALDTTHLGFVREFLKNSGPTPTIAALERLRSRAATIARTDRSTPGHDAGQIVGVIDKIMNGTEAGPLLSKARAARKAQGAEFERQGSLRALVNEKAGTADRAVALEDTFNKTVLGGSIQDLRNVTRTLLNTGRGTRKQGRQAFKELAGQTLDYIRAEATRGAAPMENGRPAVSAAGFVNVVEKKIGRAKLEVLLGKSMADEVFRLAQSAKDLLTEPPSRQVGSPTMSKILRWMDHGSRIPLVGPVAAGGAKLAGAAYKMGRASADATNALGTPLADAAKAPAPYRLAELARSAAEKGQPLAIPLAAIEASRQ